MTQRAAAQVTRIIAQRLGAGPAERTVQRLFVGLGLNNRTGQAPPPQAHGRFEADRPNELWISDGLHAGSVRGPLIDGRDTVLCAIIDDHSRFIVWARWGFAEDTLALQAVLHDAVKIHGCPDAFYCDNGSAFSSGNLAWSLAVLNIRIIHSRVGHPRGRGKIERWNGTVRTQFLVEVETGRGVGGSPVSSLSELNQLFNAWLHQHYHQQVHGETGQAPVARYHAGDNDLSRRPGLDRLHRAFLWRERRKVTGARTVSLLGNNYEVDGALIGQWVDLLFNPFDLARIDVEYKGRPMGRAHPFKIGRHVHPDVKGPAKPEPVHMSGIDYLRLVETEHHKQVGKAINFSAFDEPASTDTTTAEAAGGDDAPDQC